jgi:hypothetical protein
MLGEPARAHGAQIVLFTPPVPAQAVALGHGASRSQYLGDDVVDRHAAPEQRRCAGDLGRMHRRIAGAAVLHGCQPALHVDRRLANLAGGQGGEWICEIPDRAGLAGACLAREQRRERGEPDLERLDRIGLIVLSAGDDNLEPITSFGVMRSGNPHQACTLGDAAVAGEAISQPEQHRLHPGYVRLGGLQRFGEPPIGVQPMAGVHDPIRGQRQGRQRRLELGRRGLCL